MPRPAKEPKKFEGRTAPPLTPEARENMLISLAMDRAEEQLRDGTASAQVIVHYLRLGTQKERLEQQQLAKKNELLSAKTDSIKSAERTEELYAKAIEAFKRYGGHDGEEDDYYDE